MQGNVNMTIPGGETVAGEFEMTSDELVIYEVKSSPLWGAFGLVGALVGNAIAKRSVAFDLKFKWIEKIEKGKFGIRKNACYITTKTGEIYIAIFNHPEETIDYLQRVVDQCSDEGAWADS
jgi:hypothetical protein